MITHDPAGLDRCDEVVVGSRVGQRGPHAALLGADGWCRRACGTAGLAGR